VKLTFVLAVALATVLPLGAQQKGLLSWAPKPKTLPRYVPPERPLTKLAELRSKHRSDKDWREVVVDDDHLNGVYVSMGPGEKTPPRFHPDTREWWVVADGQIRFNIEGQEPFVASKGWLVQAPYRTVYTMETVGDKPSLRFEVNIAHARTMYPRGEKPPAMPGYDWILVRLPQPPGVYDRGNRPYLIYDEIAAEFDKQPKKSGVQRFINDDRAVSNAIYGYAKDLPPANPSDRGHYHAECAEFWVILAGQMEYKLEGQPTLIANVGDIVYAPRMTFHRPRFYGDAPACRLAMNGYPEIGHLFDTTPEQTDGK
jgi:mannose-6-phosphate isomerase-like protein (cupin superfamily)